MNKCILKYWTILVRIWLPATLAVIGTQTMGVASAQSMAGSAGGQMQPWEKCNMDPQLVNINFFTEAQADSNTLVSVTLNSITNQLTGTGCDNWVTNSPSAGQVKISDQYVLTVIATNLTSLYLTLEAPSPLNLPNRKHPKENFNRNYQIFVNNQPPPQ